MSSISDSGVSLRPDADQMRTMLSAIVVPGSPFEIRALKCRRKTSDGLDDDPFTKAQSGYFTDVETAVAHAVRFTGNDCSGVHVTVNPLAAHVRSWGLNRIKKGKAAGDADVVRYRCLYIDIDAKRPSDTNATKHERAAARARARQLLTYLRDLEWLEPAWAGSSGSGSLLLYHIDLEPTDADLVQRVLQRLSERFSDGSVAIDTSTGNPGRLVRLAGSVNAKSITPTHDRPWKLATGKAPSKPGIVSRGQLEAIASDKSEPVTGKLVLGSGPQKDMPLILSNSGISFREKPREYGTVFEIDDCLTSSEHQDGACFIQFPSGAVAYKCLHNSCSDKTWHDVKPLLKLPAHQTGASMSIGPRTGADGPIILPPPDFPADWEAPIPFDDPTGPPFPLDALPSRLRDYVLAVATDSGAPVDLVAWCALATIGAATRGRYVVAPKPTWREPVHIQSLQVVSSGGGKSPAYGLITKPLLIWDNQQAENAGERLTDWKIKEKRLQAAEKLAQKELDRPGAGADAQLKLEAVQLEIVKHTAERPIAQHIIVNDITPQAIWRFLYRQREAGLRSMQKADSCEMFIATRMLPSSIRSWRGSVVVRTTCDVPGTRTTTAR